MTTPTQKFLSERVDLAALQTLEKEYDFQPDQIMAVSLDAMSGDGIWFFPRGMGGGGGLPLLTQGPLIFPGVVDNQHLRIENREAISRRLILTAQRGYPLAAIQTPTSVAKPTSTLIQSQSVYGPLWTITGDRTHTHLHIGRYVLFAVCGWEYQNPFQNVVINAVAVGGVTATKVAEGVGTNAGAFMKSTVQWWLADVPANNNVNIVVDIITGTTVLQAYYAHAYSFADGIRIGNVDIDALAGAGTMSLSVVGALSSSTILCMAQAGSDPVAAFTEGAGADVWVAQFFNGATANGQMHRRVGAGQALFSYTAAANTRSAAAAAIEIALS